MGSLSRSLNKTMVEPMHPIIKELEYKCQSPDHKEIYKIKKDSRKSIFPKMSTVKKPKILKCEKVNNKLNIRETSNKKPPRGKAENISKNNKGKGIQFRNRKNGTIKRFDCSQPESVRNAPYTRIKTSVDHTPRVTQNFKFNIKNLSAKKELEREKLKESEIKESVRKVINNAKLKINAPVVNETRERNHLIDSNSKKLKEYLHNTDYYEMKCLNIETRKNNVEKDIRKGMDRINELIKKFCKFNAK